MMLAGILSPIGRWLSLVGGCRQMPPGRPNVRQQWPKPSPHFRRFDIIRIEMLILISVSTAGCATVPLVEE